MGVGRGGEEGRGRLPGESELGLRVAGARSAVSGRNQGPGVKVSKRQKVSSSGDEGRWAGFDGTEARVHFYFGDPSLPTRN